jgi:hypothetical protein
MTEIQSTNALGIVLLIAALVHVVATVFVPFLRCRTVRNERQVRT